MFSHQHGSVQYNRLSPKTSSTTEKKQKKNHPTSHNIITLKNQFTQPGWIYDSGCISLLWPTDKVLPLRRALCVDLNANIPTIIKIHHMNLSVRTPGPEAVRYCFILLVTYKQLFPENSTHMLALRSFIRACSHVCSRWRLLSPFLLGG